MIKMSSIPKKLPELYTTKYKEFLLVYNPLSELNLILLNLPAQICFNEIDNKKTLTKIYKNILKIYPNWSIKEFFFYFKNLEESKIIYLSKNPTKPKFKKTEELCAWLHITNQCNLRCTY